MTFFAATPAKGDVSRVDFVSLEGFRGSYSRQMARKNPRATSDAATLAKGEIQGLEAFAFGALHGIRVPERPKGDSSGLGSFPLGANHDTHGLKRPKGDLSDVGSFPLGANHDILATKRSEGDSPECESVTLGPIYGTPSHRCRRMLQG